MGWVRLGTIGSKIMLQARLIGLRRQQVLAQGGSKSNSFRLLLPRVALGLSLFAQEVEQGNNIERLFHRLYFRSSHRLRGEEY